jgi:hypothetical protein
MISLSVATITHPMIALLRFCLLLIVLGCLLTSRATASGDENWSGFGIPGVDGEVDAMVVSGNDIYIGGSFRNAAGTYVGGIARWNTVENRWYALGDGGHTGVDGTVLAMAIRGEEIFVGGEFTAAGGIKAFNIAVYNTRTRLWSTWAVVRDGEQGVRSMPSLPPAPMSMQGVTLW